MTTTFTLFNVVFTWGTLFQVLLIVLGLITLVRVFAETLQDAFCALQKRWNNREALQRKLARARVYGGVW